MDAPLLQIGTKIDEKSVQYAKSLVETVFKSGFQHHMEQETIRETMRLAFGSLVTHHNTVTGCSFTGNRVIER